MESNINEGSRLGSVHVNSRQYDRLYAHGDATRQIIVNVVCSALGVDRADLHARTRKSASVAFARQIAMYLAHVGCGMSLKESAALFSRDRTTAAHACCIVEDRRDDPVFDGLMDQLERTIAYLRAPVCRIGPS